MTQRSTKLLLYVLLMAILLATLTEAGDKKHKNKYSADANNPSKFEDSFALDTNDIPPPPPERNDIDFRTLHKPFRMAKLNMVWSKAQQVILPIRTTVMMNPFFRLNC